MNRTNKKSRQIPESLGAAPVFIINSLSNENQKIAVCGCALSTRGGIY